MSLSLLDDLGPSAVLDRYAGLSWSYSRRELLDQCTRRYLYQYYSDALKDPAIRSEVLRLRKLKNRHLRTGALVHLVISTYFKKWKQGKTLSADWWLTNWARQLFAQDQRYSKYIRAGGIDANRKFPPTILDEIVNTVDDHAGLLAQVEKQMVLCIQNFFTAEAFAELRALGTSADSLIEHKMFLKGFSTPVSGKIDLVVPRQGLVTLVDWKLGPPSDGGAESLQLAAYGLWAMSDFEVSENQVQIMKAHLATAEVIGFQVGAKAFANARVRIHQDLERMVILHDYGKAGTVEAFSPMPQPGVCRLCPFRTICPEGEAATHAGN